MPTWVMSLERWKVLVTHVLSAAHGGWRSALPKSPESLGHSCQKGISRYLRRGGNYWAVQTTDCHSLLHKCYYPFTFMHMVVFRNLEKNHPSTFSASSLIPLVQMEVPFFRAKKSKAFKVCLSHNNQGIHFFQM